MNEACCTVNVLTVSPCDSDLVILSNLMSHSAWQFRSARTLKEAKAALSEGSVQVVLCEADLPDGNWLELLEHLRTLPESPELIVLSRQADERLWSAVLNKGAWDVLEKPFRAQDVYRSVHHAWRHRMESRRIPRRPSQGSLGGRVAATA